MDSVPSDIADTLARALGDAIVRIWGDLPQDVQELLFEETVAALGEDQREQLAVFLHEKHPRTANPLGKPRETPEPDSHGG
jgi:hypothetical protein